MNFETHCLHRQHFVIIISLFPIIFYTSFTLLMIVNNLNIYTFMKLFLFLITFYEFGDVKDLADVKHHIEDTVLVGIVQGNNYWY